MSRFAGPIEKFKKTGAEKLFERFAKNGNSFTPTAPDPRDVYLSRESNALIADIRKNPPPRAWMEDRAASRGQPAGRY